MSYNGSECHLPRSYGVWGRGKDSEGDEGRGLLVIPQCPLRQNRRTSRELRSHAPRLQAARRAFYDFHGFLDLELFYLLHMYKLIRERRGGAGAAEGSRGRAVPMVRVVLTTPVLQKYVKYNTDTKCLLIPNENIVDICIEEPVLQSCCIIDLSHNALLSGKHIFRLHPELWWLNLRRNNIASLNDMGMPPCLGLLDLTENAMASIISELTFIRQITILKLNLYIPSSLTSKELKMSASTASVFATFTANYKNSRKKVLPYLQNVWCLDNDFVCAAERRRATERNVEAAITDESADMSKSLSKVVASHVGYSTAPANSRTKRLLHSINNLPTKVALSEQYKLDILLEEYLEQMEVLKDHSSHLPRLEIDLLHLLDLPLRVRLDLCTLLVVMIVHPLDEGLFSAALQRLLLPLLPSEHISALPRLPIYVLSALVSQLSQIMRREMEELDFVGYLTPKHLCGLAAMQGASHPYASSYASHRTFSFLRPVKEYLSTPLQELVHSGRRHLRKDVDMAALRAASATYSDEERSIVSCLLAKGVYTRATSGGSASPELAKIFCHAAAYIRDSLFTFDSGSAISARLHLHLLKNSNAIQKRVDALRPLANSAGLPTDFADAALPRGLFIGVPTRAPQFILDAEAVSGTDYEEDAGIWDETRDNYRPGQSMFSDNLSPPPSPEHRTPRTSPPRRASPEITEYRRIVIMPVEKKKFLSQRLSPAKPPLSPISRVGSGGGAHNAAFDAGALEALSSYRSLAPVPPSAGDPSGEEDASREGDEALSENSFIGVAGNEVRIVPEGDRVDETFYLETAADARRRMLAEMGSLRNARGSVYNAKDKALLLNLDTRPYVSRVAPQARAVPLVCADPPELKLGDIMTELMERLQTPVSQQRHRRSGEHAAGEDTAFGLLETNNVNYNHRQTKFIE